MRITDFINSYTEESEKKGLYYYVNKRKKAGTSRSKNNPKAPSAQDWKNAAKTAKKESIGESVIPWDGKAVVVYDATGANLLDTLDINVAAQKYGLNSNDIRNQLKIQQYTKLKGPKGEFMVSHPMAPTALDAEPGFATESDNDHDLFSNRRRRPQDEPTSPVASSIIRRIMLQRPDLLSHGPEAVGNAVDEVAEWVGDVEEIGSSDVSGWVRQVERILQGNQGVAEGTDTDPVWNQYGHYSVQDLVQEFPNLSPKDAQTIVNFAEYGWSNMPNRQEYRNQVVQRIQQAIKGEQGVAEGSSDGMSYRAAYVAGEIEHARQTGQTYQFEPEEDNPQFKSLVTKYLQQYGQHDLAEGVMEAIPLDKLRSTGTRVKDEVSAKLKQNGPLGRDAEKAKQNGKPVEQGVAEEHDDEFAHSDRAANEIAVGRWRRGGELTGTSLKGYIETTYEQLESVLGEPVYGPNDTDGDKITCEWVITFQDGTVATVYDWKTGETPMDLHNWHIGGNSHKANDYIGTLMSGKGDLKSSLWEGRTGLYVDGTLKRVFESKAIADKLLPNARTWFPNQTVELLAMTEDATGGSSCSSSIGAVITELGDGGISKRQLNAKLGKYTNIARKPKQIKVKGGY